VSAALADRLPPSINLSVVGFWQDRQRWNVKDDVTQRRRLRNAVERTSLEAHNRRATE
jgi:hypothetical protein